MVYTGFLHLHSFLRWIALLLIIVSVIFAFQGLLRKRSFTKTDDRLSLFTMISFHLQLLVGIVLYFVSPVVEAARQDFSTSMKDPVLRFFLVEHAFAMIIAIALVTVGRIRSRKAESDRGKFVQLAIFYTIALIIVLWAIPWPFTLVGAGRSWM